MILLYFFAALQFQRWFQRILEIQLSDQEEMLSVVDSGFVRSQPHLLMSQTQPVIV